MEDTKLLSKRLFREFLSEVTAEQDDVINTYKDIIISVGFDDEENSYYITWEDDEVFEDVYPEDGEELYDVYLRVYNKVKEIVI